MGGGGNDRSCLIPAQLKAGYWGPKPGLFVVSRSFCWAKAPDQLPTAAMKFPRVRRLALPQTQNGLNLVKSEGQ